MAIARHNGNELLAAIDPKVRTSFGNAGGIAEFRRFWKLEGKDGDAWSASRIWSELGAVLALGGSFDPRKGTFVAPYVFSRWPEKYDAFEHVAIVASRVRVRSAPRANADVLGQLSFTIVPLAKLSKPLPEGNPWTAVKLLDGRTGYVSSAFVRSPTGYRGIFARSGGRWRLTTFVAGD